MMLIFSNRDALHPHSRHCGEAVATIPFSGIHADDPVIWVRFSDGTEAGVNRSDLYPPEQIGTCVATHWHGDGRGGGTPHPRHESCILWERQA